MIAVIIAEGACNFLPFWGYTSKIMSGYQCIGIIKPEMSETFMKLSYNRIFI